MNFYDIKMVQIKKKKNQITYIVKDVCRNTTVQIGSNK